MRLLLSHKFNVYGVHMKPFTIAHPQAEMGCFANQDFIEQDVIGYYYGRLVYQFTVDPLSACSVHGADVMAVTCGQCHTSSIRVENEVSSLDGILQAVCLMHARFACPHLMNNPRFLSSEIDPSDGRPKEARSENV